MQRLYSLVALVVLVLFSSTMVFGQSDRLDAKFRFGEAVLRGRVVNNNGENIKLGITDGGMFTWMFNSTHIEITTDEHGCFEFRLKNCVPWINYLLSSHEVGLRVQIFSTPCDTVDMIIDMAAFKRKNDKERAPAVRDTICYATFRGLLSDVNKDMNQYDIFSEYYMPMFFRNQSLAESVSKMTVVELAQAISDRYKELLSKLAVDIRLCAATREIVEYNLTCRFADELTNAGATVDIAKYIVTQNAPKQAPGATPIEFFEPLKKYNLNSPKFIAFGNFDVQRAVELGVAVSGLSKGGYVLDVVQEILDFGIAAENHKQKFIDYLALEKDTTASQDILLSLRNEMFNLTEEYTQKLNISKALVGLKNYFGYSSGPIIDMITAMPYAGDIYELRPLSPQTLAQLKAKISEPAIYQQIKMLNDKLIAKIEADKKNADYRIYDIAYIENDKLISHIQSLFPNKMLVIDFWATWCAPCVMANREYAPVKKEFKDKDVVFVYITNPTSPKQTWENMLPTISGEHFYLTDEQWQYLTEKYNFRGVPSYLYIDSDGKQLDSHTGGIRADEFRKKITDGIK